MAQAITLVNDYTPIINLVLDSVSSQNSKRAYSKALVDFMGWYQSAGYTKLNKSVVQRYRSEVLEGSRLAPSTINLRLCALRKFAAEAQDNGKLPPTIALGISRLKA